jgi:hypothetical protein
VCVASGYWSSPAAAGGWSFINKSTSRKGFLLTLGRLAPLACALTPLLADGLNRYLCFILLPVPTFGFGVSLEPLASLFAVVAFFLILSCHPLALVLWLVREAVAHFDTP